MCQVCYGPSLSCAEFAMCRVVPKSGYTHDHRADKYPYPHDRRANKQASIAY